MLLAAGRGRRMRPLSDDCAKPLLRVGGRSLIERQLEALGAAGFDEVVINLAYRGAQIRAALGDGGRWGLRLRYSDEGARALDTAGGIRRALPLLGEEPFLVANADLWTDFPYRQAGLARGDLAWLVLVDNPEHNPRGDFVLRGGRVGDATAPALTFAGIGVYHPELFAGLDPGPAPLAPLLRRAAQAGRVGGVHYRGVWADVGTPQRLQQLREAQGTD